MGKISEEEIKTEKNDNPVKETIDNTKNEDLQNLNKPSLKKTHKNTKTIKKIEKNKTSNNKIKVKIKRKRIHIIKQKKQNKD